MPRRIDTEAVINAVRLDEQAGDPAQPAAGFWLVYAKANGLYVQDDAGNVTGPFAAGGGVATDTIWDAAGDLVQGTGVDAASRLAIGTSGQILKTNAGANAVEWGDYPDFSGCVLTKSVVQSINNASETAVTFDGEVFDTDAYHDNGVNNTRFTAPATGYYMVGGTVEMDAMSDQKYVITRIRKGGANVDGDGRGRQSTSGGSIAVGANHFRVVQLNSGQYVELTVEHNHGSARDARTTINGTSFWIYRVA